MPRNPIIYKTTLNPLSDTDENANISVFFGSAKASKCTYGEVEVARGVVGKGKEADGWVL